ncbi:hypothetical protein MYO4S_00222 [Serratia phage 4S]|nr:hypothetical protein MYO4S_00222 [Serratia phage 4S]
MLVAKVTNVNAGYKYDQEKAADLLHKFGDNIIPIDRIFIGRSNTTVKFKDIPNDYNSVNFTFYIKGNIALEEIDIFKTKHPDIIYTYGWF